MPIVAACTPNDGEQIVGCPRNSTVLPAHARVGHECRLGGYLLYGTTDVNPCGNFSDTSSLKFLKTKGSIGHAFTVCIHTENQNQRSFYPFVLHEISVLIELLLGHLCYRLTDVPPQPNSPPDFVSRVENADKQHASPETDDRKATSRTNEISKLMSGVVVFHRRFASPTYATPPKSIHKV